MTDSPSYIYTQHLVCSADNFRKNKLVLLFAGDRLLVNGDNCFWSEAELELLQAARCSDRPGLEAPELEHFFLGYQKSQACAAVDLGQDYSAQIKAEAVSVREFLLRSGPEDFELVGIGNQILNWRRTHRYCGACGHPTRAHERERALVCSHCAMTVYPRINPCVIVLVNRGPEILLARHVKAKSAWYSCLAGFIEAGETPEQTIMREVMEEVNIEVSNIRYVKSQSWPFPSQLMLGFFADYRSGTVRPDQNEIAEAAWYPLNELPMTPSAELSVAGELIKLYKERS